MKDAKGHGSNPRGGVVAPDPAAHQMAINDLVPNRANIGWVKKMAAQDSQYGGQSAIDMYRARIRAGETLKPMAVSGRKIMDGHTRYLAYKAEKVKYAPVMRVNEKGYPV